MPHDPRMHRAPNAPVVIAMAPSRRAEPPEREEGWVGYNLVILACCLIALGLMVASEVGRHDDEVRSLIDWGDAAVCVVFLIDFFISLVRAENRWRYLVTWGWIDLLSAIPSLNAARWGRAARILRVMRIIRGIKAARIALSLVAHYRTRNAMLAGGLMVIFAAFAGSFAILQVESDPRSMIKTAEDALWWSICTITTVGYGDLYPVTRAGRIIAGLLMLTGVSMFGALAGMLASWFTGTADEAKQADIRALTAEIAALRETVGERTSGSSRSTDRIAA